MRLPLIVFSIGIAAAVGGNVAAAQDRYGDPRSAPSGNDAIYQGRDGPRGDPQDPRYDDRRGDPRDDDRRSDPRYDNARGPRPEAVFFADDRFGGRSLTLDRGVRRLGETGMEDKISSVRINSGRWLVCSDDDFRGRCVTLDRSIGKLSRIGMEDKISSVRPIRGDDRY